MQQFYLDERHGTPRTQRCDACAPVSRLEDQGVNKTSTSRQEHRDAREGHQSTAPAHDRRHEERAQIRRSVWITLHSLARICMTGLDRSCGRHLDELIETAFDFSTRYQSSSISSRYAA